MGTTIKQFVPLFPSPVFFFVFHCFAYDMQSTALFLAIVAFFLIVRDSTKIVPLRVLDLICMSVISSVTNNKHCALLTMKFFLQHKDVLYAG
jgi:hypothetical protein